MTVSGDSRGQYSYAVTVGNAIRTTLTPMTFSKPNFNGVQIDFASDKIRRHRNWPRGINDPAVGVTINPRRQSNSTSLLGGRALAQVGDFITVGGTLVNAHNANTALDMFEGNLLAGNLTSGQTSTPVTAIAIVLSDDSPEDEAGGAALFSHDIRIKSRDFETGLETVLTLDEVVREGSGVANRIRRFSAHWLCGRRRHRANHPQLRLYGPGVCGAGSNFYSRSGVRLCAGQ